MIERYFDRGDKARAELAADEVKELLVFELMEKGVRRPEPPKLFPEKFPEAEKETFYTVKFETGNSWDYCTLGVYCATAEEAEAIAKLTFFRSDRDYDLPDTYQHVSPLLGGKVESKEFCSAQDLVNIKADAKAAAANAEANKKANTEYSDALKAVEEATSVFWDDWHEQREKLERARVVQKTMAEYVETCEGDTITAARFLSKVHTAEDIVLAREWLGLAVPKVFEEGGVVAEVEVEASGELADELVAKERGGA